MDQILNDCIERRPVVAEHIDKAVRNNDSCTVGRLVVAAISDQIDYKLDFLERINEMCKNPQARLELHHYETLRAQVPRGV